MSSLMYILIAILVWMAYTMYNSYVGMQKELREIRLKCMGTATSVYNKEPVEAMRSTVVEALSRFAALSKP